MSERRYFPPLASVTGDLGGQPPVDQAQPGWHLDVFMHSQHTGFLDAPLWLPTGSTRGVDIGAITIGCSSALRPGTEVPHG